MVVGPAYYLCTVCLTRQFAPERGGAREEDTGVNRGRPQSRATKKISFENENKKCEAGTITRLCQLRVVGGSWTIFLSLCLLRVCLPPHLAPLFFQGNNPASTLRASLARML